MEAVVIHILVVAGDVRKWPQVGVEVNVALMLVDRELEVMRRGSRGVSAEVLVVGFVVAPCSVPV